MKRVWIVDDEDELRTIVGMIMKREGYDVLEVEDGKKCLELLQSGEHPDLILLDVMMPGIDGWTVCRKIKNDPVLRPIPICILTAKNAPADVQMSLNKAGANWHLNKPVDRKRLIEAVAWFLKRSLNKKP
jgi:two-component system response regulator ResD